MGQRNTRDTSVQNPDCHLVGDQHDLASLDRLPGILSESHHPLRNLTIGLTPTRCERIAQRHPNRGLREQPRCGEPGALKKVEALIEALINLYRQTQFVCERRRRFLSSLQRAGVNLGDRPCRQSTGASSGHLLATVAEPIALKSAIQNALGVMNFAMPDEVKEVCRHDPSLRGASSGESGSQLDSTLVTTRTRIADLAQTPDGTTVSVGGFIETVRDQKKVQFIILRDESGSAQLVNPALREEDPDAESSPERRALTDAISELTGGTFVWVTGELKLDERVKLGGLEVKIHTLDVTGTAEPEPPIAEDSSVDKRMDWRFLDLRRPQANLIFRAQTAFEHGLRSWWVENNWIEIHTPKLMASASESRAELFEVGYFDTTAYLAQSPQFFKQMAQPAGFGAVFEIAPAFRADPSFTARHATEFTSVDAEMSWVDSHHEVMDMHEQVLISGITAVVQKHGAQIAELMGVELTVPTTPFPRVTLQEARDIVSAGGYDIPRADGDLDPEAERRLSAYIQETLGHPFVFVTDYDTSIRPFYHMRHADNDALTKSYDLLYRGTEISTGAQREHRIEVLEAQAKDKGMHLDELESYFDFFRHGVPPHGGFGMGLARVMMLMLEQSSIRETTFLFRGPNRLLP